jgi:4-amino-4-deoxy-L-arabinose transferase-like glycosyltransferase
MSVSSLETAISQRPGATLASFLALHLAVWTALPTLLYPNLPLDLIEALTYGREWQLGYDKLPPLPWWLVEIAWQLTGQNIHADIAYYLLAQIAVCIALTAVWATARPIVGPVGALAALMIVDGLHYLNFTAAKFNHDVIQLPLWALAGFAFHRSLRSGAWRYWLLLGLAIGLSLWAKYFVVMLAAPMALFLLFDREARKHLATPGPYVGAVVALIVMLPHLVWLVHNDFLPLAYAEARAQPSRGLIDHLWHPVQFIVGQWFFMIPALIIAAALFVPRASETPPTGDAYDRRIVALLAFGPAVGVVVLAAVSGRGAIAMWGYPLWMFLGLWLVMVCRTLLSGLRLRRLVTTWAIVFTGFAAVFVVSYAVLPAYDHRYRAVFFPGDRLAQEMSARFRALTGKPLAYIVATMWDGGNAAHYSPERPQPRVLIDGKPARAPWIDLADLHSKGAVIVWTGSDPTVLPAMFRTIGADAEIQQPFALPYRRGSGEVHVGWALLRPRPALAALGVEFNSR